MGVVSGCGQTCGFDSHRYIIHDGVLLRYSPSQLTI